MPEYIFLHVELLPAGIDAGTNDNDGVRVGPGQDAFRGPRGSEASDTPKADTPLVGFSPFLKEQL
jgi:hypothetical protein